MPAVPATLSKSRIILHRTARTNVGQVMFQPEDGVGAVWALVMDHEFWSEHLGKPEILTVTIRPGDHLN